MPRCRNTVSCPSPRDRPEEPATTFAWPWPASLRIHTRPGPSLRRPHRRGETWDASECRLRVEQTWLWSLHNFRGKKRKTKPVLAGFSFIENTGQRFAPLAAYSDVQRHYDPSPTRLIRSISFLLILILPSFSSLSRRFCT